MSRNIFPRVVIDPQLSFLKDIVGWSVSGVGIVVLPLTWSGLSRFLSPMSVSCSPPPRTELQIRRERKPSGSPIDIAADSTSSIPRARSARVGRRRTWESERRSNCCFYFVKFLPQTYWTAYWDSMSLDFRCRGPRIGLLIHISWSNVSCNIWDMHWLLNLYTRPNLLYTTYIHWKSSLCHFRHF